VLATHVLPCCGGVSCCSFVFLRWRVQKEKSKKRVWMYGPKADRSSDHRIDMHGRWPLAPRGARSAIDKKKKGGREREILCPGKGATFHDFTARSHGQDFSDCTRGVQSKLKGGGILCPGKGDLAAWAEGPEFPIALIVCVRFFAFFFLSSAADRGGARQGA